MAMARTDEVRYSITVMPAGKKMAWVVYSARSGLRRGVAIVSRMHHDDFFGSPWAQASPCFSTSRTSSSSVS
jgi:hypothetical protein